MQSYSPPSKSNEVLIDNKMQPHSSSKKGAINYKFFLSLLDLYIDNNGELKGNIKRNIKKITQWLPEVLKPEFNINEMIVKLPGETIPLLCLLAKKATTHNLTQQLFGMLIDAIPVHKLQEPFLNDELYLTLGDSKGTISHYIAFNPTPEYKIVEKLIQKIGYSQLTQKGRLPFEFLIREGNIKLLEILNELEKKLSIKIINTSKTYLTLSQTAYRDKKNELTHSLELARGQREISNNSQYYLRQQKIINAILSRLSEEGYKKISDFILERSKKESENKTYNKNYTIKNFFECIEKDNILEFKQLREYYSGININQCYDLENTHSTFINYAIIHKSKKIIQYLLEQDVDLDVAVAHSGNALDCAVVTCDLEIIELILNKTPTSFIDFSTFHVLVLELKDKNTAKDKNTLISALQLLLNKLSELSFHEQQTILNDTDRTWLTLLHHLIDESPDQENKKSNERHPSSDALLIALENKAFDVNKPGGEDLLTPLEYAVKLNKTNAVKALVTIPTVNINLKNIVQIALQHDAFNSLNMILVPSEKINDDIIKTFMYEMKKKLQIKKPDDFVALTETFDILHKKLSHKGKGKNLWFHALLLGINNNLPEMTEMLLSKSSHDFLVKGVWNKLKSIAKTKGMTSLDITIDSFIAKLNEKSKLLVKPAENKEIVDNLSESKKEQKKEKEENERSNISTTQPIVTPTKSSVLISQYPTAQDIPTIQPIVTPTESTSSTIQILKRPVMPSLPSALISQYAPKVPDAAVTFSRPKVSEIKTKTVIHPSFFNRNFEWRRAIQSQVSHPLLEAQQSMSGTDILKKIYSDHTAQIVTCLFSTYFPLEEFTLSVGTWNMLDPCYSKGDYINNPWNINENNSTYKDRAQNLIKAILLMLRKRHLMFLQEIDFLVAEEHKSLRENFLKELKTQGFDCIISCGPKQQPLALIYNTYTFEYITSVGALPHNRRNKEGQISPNPNGRNRACIYYLTHKLTRLPVAAVNCHLPYEWKPDEYTHYVLELCKELSKHSLVLFGGDQNHCVNQMKETDMFKAFVETMFPPPIIFPANTMTLFQRNLEKLSGKDIESNLCFDYFIILGGPRISAVEKIGMEIHCFQVQDDENTMKRLVWKSTIKSFTYQGEEKIIRHPSTLLCRLPIQLAPSIQPTPSLTSEIPPHPMEKRRFKK